MTNFNNLFCLDQVVKIYIPGTFNVNEPATELQNKLTNEALELFATLFGGATFSRNVGAWMSPGRGLVTEDVNIVYAFCTADQFRSGFERVVSFARSVCERMKQDAVSLEYNGKLAFIS